MTSFLSAAQLRDQRLELAGAAAHVLNGGVARGTALVIHGGLGVRWAALEALAPMSRRVDAVALVGFDDLPAAALSAAGWSLDRVVRVVAPPGRLLDVAAHLAEVVDLLVVTEHLVDARWPRLLARVRRRRGVVAVVEHTCHQSRHQVLAAGGSTTVLEVVGVDVVGSTSVPERLRVRLVRGTLQAQRALHVVEGVR